MYKITIELIWVYGIHDTAIDSNKTVKISLTYSDFNQCFTHRNQSYSHLKLHSDHRILTMKDVHTINTLIDLPEKPLKSTYFRHPTLTPSLLGNPRKD